MKIMHIETGRHLYGGALQVCYLMEGLAHHGVENLLVCTTGSQIAKEAKSYATVLELPLRGDLDPLFPLRLIRLIRQCRPNLVHAHSRRGADLWGGVCARMAGIPSVVTRRVDNREWPPFVRFKYGSYDQVVSISEGIRQVLLAEGLAPDRVMCIHSVVRQEHYQASRDREWFMQQFDVAVDAPVIGVIAQLIPRKGHRFLLEITHRLREQFPTIRILFFGQGPLREELERFIAKRNLDSVVTLAGFRDDMPKILPCLDLVVHPALMEGLGVSLLQAAAAGVPIVGARAGGIPEVVHDGVNGLLVEPGNTEQLLSAVSRVLVEQGLGQQFGMAGKFLVQQQFSVDSMVDSYLRIYHNYLPAVS